MHRLRARVRPSEPQHFPAQQAHKRTKSRKQTSTIVVIVLFQGYDGGGRPTAFDIMLHVIADPYDSADSDGKVTSTVQAKNVRVTNLRLASNGECAAQAKVKPSCCLHPAPPFDLFPFQLLHSARVPHPFSERENLY